MMEGRGSSLGTLRDYKAEEAFPKGHFFIEMTWSEQGKGIKAGQYPNIRATVKLVNLQSKLQITLKAGESEQ